MTPTVLVGKKDVVVHCPPTAIDPPLEADPQFIEGEFHALQASLHLFEKILEVNSSLRFTVSGMACHHRKCCILFDYVAFLINRNLLLHSSAPWVICRWTPVAEDYTTTNYYFRKGKPDHKGPGIFLLSRKEWCHFVLAVVRLGVLAASSSRSFCLPVDVSECL